MGSYSNSQSRYSCFTPCSVWSVSDEGHDPHNHTFTCLNPVSQLLSLSLSQIEMLATFLSHCRKAWPPQAPLGPPLWFEPGGVSMSLVYCGRCVSVCVCERARRPDREGLCRTRSWAAVGGLPLTHIYLIRSQSEHRLRAVLWR